MKQTNPAFKVQPGLSVKGKDLLTRVKNRSINLNSKGYYGNYPEMFEVNKLDKVGLANKIKENQGKINNLKNKLANG